MLADIIDLLADPTDGTPLHGEGNFTRLVSESGHSFDVARQGYVTLAGGSGLKYSGDDIAMIDARERFLGEGHFAPFVEAVSHTVIEVLGEADLPEDATPALCEIGAGTGYYLSHTLDSLHYGRGVGLDASVAAAKRLAKAHPRIGAVVADAWARLPLRESCIDAITVIFAPRNPAEFARVLTPAGQVVVLTAEPGHLSELREPLGIIDVERGKVDRLIEQAAGYLRPVGDSEFLEFPMHLGKQSIAAQVAMSPSARHLDPAQLAERVAALPEVMTVTARAAITRLARV